jgi:glycosyltransferase involved in cell wall biosynthesis
MRVLYLIDTMAVGGAESLLADLARQLLKDKPGTRVEIITLYRLGMHGKRLQEEGAIPVTALHASRKYDLRLAPRLFHFIKDKDYDIIHTHLFPAGYVAGLASLLTHRPKWVYTEHSCWNRRRAHRLLRPVERFVYSRFCSIIAVSGNVRSALVQWQPQLEPKVVTIPNGVVVPRDIRRAPAAFNGRPLRFIVVGRLVPAKGLDLLLDALSMISERDFAVQVVGDGSQRMELERLAELYGLGNKVEFLGIRSDVQQLMQQSDCLLVPSRWEGLPMVILEAMACGLPVIATPVGGIPEVIEDGVNGYLVPAESVELLAQRLEEVIDNPHILRALGKRARKKVIDGHSIEALAAAHYSLYERLLDA